MHAVLYSNIECTQLNLLCELVGSDPCYGLPHNLHLVVDAFYGDEHLPQRSRVHNILHELHCSQERENGRTKLAAQMYVRMYVWTHTSTKHTYMNTNVHTYVCMYVIYSLGSLVPMYGMHMICKYAHNHTISFSILLYP